MVFHYTCNAIWTNTLHVKLTFLHVIPLYWIGTAAIQFNGVPVTLTRKLRTKLSNAVRTYLMKKLSRFLQLYFLISVRHNLSVATSVFYESFTKRNKIIASILLVGHLLTMHSTRIHCRIDVATVLYIIIFLNLVSFKKVWC